MLRSAATILGLLGIFGAVATGPNLSEAQTLDQRISAMRDRQVRATVEEVARRQSIDLRLRNVIDTVDFDAVELRDTFDWFSSVTGVPLVVDWRALEFEGVDPAQRITLQLRHVPAGQLLGVLMQMATPQGLPGDSTLMYDITPWYVQVMTRRQADGQLVTRVYEVGDMLMEIPQFTDAPEFDLNSALSNTNSGGSNARGGGNTGLFGDDDRTGRETATTRAQRAEALVTLIQDTVEPHVWDINGGRSTVRVLGSRLIVSAPRYVHAQIGVPTIAMDRLIDADSAQPAARTALVPQDRASTSSPRRDPAGGGISNTQRTRSGVSGVQR